MTALSGSYFLKFWTMSFKFFSFSPFSPISRRYSSRRRFYEIMRCMRPRPMLTLPNPRGRSIVAGRTHMRCAHFCVGRDGRGLHYVTTLLPPRISHDHRLVEYFRTISAQYQNTSPWPFPSHPSQLPITLFLSSPSPRSFQSRCFRSSHHLAWTGAPTFCDPVHEVWSQTQNYHGWTTSY